MLTSFLSSFRSSLVASDLVMDIIFYRVGCAFMHSINASSLLLDTSSWLFGRIWASAMASFSSEIIVVILIASVVF